MSFRHVPATEDEFAFWIREVGDSLDSLLSGGAIAGQVSFGPVIRIGDIEVKVVNTGGLNRNLVFRNVLTGATNTIVL